ncbi:hypothetical protein DI392_14250 [Vibrio albus]|uniref:DUF2059 domain-containing protein n=2 Tax=Vibrio albus TaxID=2200953 RepID=A0A2U3B716_9VIBR|nr:hypothetical protein DI392_14250 [Vibrio albus]
MFTYEIQNLVTYCIYYRAIYSSNHILTIEIIMRKFIVCLLLLLPLQVSADDESKRNKIIELANVMHMDVLLESINEQFLTMMENITKELNVTPKEKSILRNHYKKVNDLLTQELHQGKFELFLVDMYDKNLTESEVEAMLSFYTTKEGQSILRKAPIITRESMIYGQELYKKLLPKIQSIALEIQQTLADHRA